MQVIKLECQTTYKKTGEITHSITYGVTSQCAPKASPRLLLQQTRQRWSIEGGSHQRRDVTFHEDGCDLRRGHSAHIIAILNNVAIALTTRAGFVNAARARRAFDAKPSDALHLLTVLNRDFAGAIQMSRGFSPIDTEHMFEYNPS